MQDTQNGVNNIYVFTDISALPRDCCWMYNIKLTIIIANKLVFISLSFHQTPMPLSLSCLQLLTEPYSTINHFQIRKLCTKNTLHHLTIRTEKNRHITEKLLLLCLNRFGNKQHFLYRHREEKREEEKAK